MHFTFSQTIQRTKRLQTSVFQLLTFLLSIMMSVTVWAQGKSGVSPTVLVLPQGPGSLGGIGENVSANLNMGLMSYPIKVTLPEGRNKHTPSLNIMYSSSAGSSVMGIGWSLSAGGAVERLTVRGLPTYSNNDEFYGNGELVKVPGSPFFRSRYEGAFVRYRWHQSSPSDQNGYWTAQYPDGSIDYYGGTHKGSVDKGSQVFGTEGTYRWELKARVDRNGNRIEYNYFRSGTQLYLEQISWVFGKDGKPLYQANISYEERPDPISDCKPGFDLQTTKRATGLLITSEGQRIHSYKFEFDDASGLSRLIKVTQFGVNPKEAFPVQFQIKYSDATFSEKNSQLVSMKTSVSANFKVGNSDLVDMNGDGLPDVVNTSSTTHKFHINQLTLDKDGKQATHDFPSSKTVTNSKPLLAKLSNPSVQMLDVNGDGFTDMVDAVNQLIYINKGNSKWEDKSESLKSFPKMGSSPDLRFFDYNGDKKIDVIRSDRNNTVYWVNDGKGSWNEVTGQQAIGASFSGDKVRLIDINGDGLSDAVQLLAGKLRYRKYLGYGKWSGWIDVNVPGLANEKLGDKPQFRDINGDGMADMVAFVGTSIIYFVNKNGMAFREGQELQKLAGVDIPNSNDNSIRIADMNGNGSNDIVWISNGGKVTYLELFSERPNLLKQISNGIGQRINVDYGSSVYHFIYDRDCNPKQDKGCLGPWENKLPMAFTVVNRITTWASRSTKPGEQQSPNSNELPRVQRIFYHHGYYDGTEKKFRGFRKVESLFESDGSMGARKDAFTYNLGDKDSYFHGKPLHRIVTDDAGKVFFRQTWDWKDCGTPKGAEGDVLFPVRFVCLKSLEREVVEGDESKKKVVRTEREYDGFGNITQVNEMGVKDQTGDERIYKATYITPDDAKSSKAKWLLRFLQTRGYCSSKSGPCSEVQFYYDGGEFKGLSAGQIEKGNITRIRTRVRSGEDKWIESQRQKFDSFGNVIATKTATGLLRTITWDDNYQRFPTTETVHMDGYQMKMSTQWNTKFSNVSQSTGVNGQTTFYSYDNFGRLLSRSKPGDPTGKPSTRFTYEMKAPLSKIVTEHRSKRGGEFDRKTIQCYDGMGRTLAVLIQVRPGKFRVGNHVVYNRENHPSRMWHSYENDGVCQFEAPDSVSKRTYRYDGLGRLTRTVMADGSFISAQYEPMKRLFFDEEDNKKESTHYNTPTTYITDGLGRVVEKVTVPKKGEGISTRYTYSVASPKGLSLLTSLTFADGSKKVQEYDLVGNVVKVTDADRSTTSYVYNDDNLMTSVTDARGLATVFIYDGLKRLVTRGLEGKPETQVRYHYDKVQPELKTAAFVKGRLARVEYPGGNYLMSYDKQGNTVFFRHMMMGAIFDFKRSFNNVNQLMEHILPNGQKRRFERDDSGRVLSIPGYIKTLSYNKEGMIAGWTGANRVVTTHSYDKRNRLVQLDVAGGKVFSLKYELDAQGNPIGWQQKHGDESFNHVYTYDAMYRLMQADLLDGKETLNFNLSKQYSLLSKVSSLGEKSPAHLGEYRYDEKRSHAATQTGGIKLSYDKAGHVTKRGQQEHTWNYLGKRTKTVREGETIGQYWYDHANRRTIKAELGLHMFYVTPNYQIREGAIASFLKIQHDRVVTSWTVKGVEKFFDDLAPASGDASLKAQPDGMITAGDAWLYHAAKSNIVKLSLKSRPHAMNLTQDMLMSSVQRLLLSDKETSYYNHVDHLGSVRAVTDGDGNVVLRQHFYPYGALRSQSGSIQLFRYSFQGSEWDGATQTNAFPVRSFDPSLGLWLRPDPEFHTADQVEGEFNSYAMVHNNPIRMRDVQGTEQLETVTSASKTSTKKNQNTGGTLSMADVLSGADNSPQVNGNATRPQNNQTQGGSASEAYVQQQMQQRAGKNSRQLRRRRRKKNIAAAFGAGLIMGSAAAVMIGTPSELFGNAVETSSDGGSALSGEALGAILGGGVGAGLVLAGVVVGIDHRKMVRMERARKAAAKKKAMTGGASSTKLAPPSTAGSSQQRKRPKARKRGK